MNYSLQSYRLIIERALASGYDFAPFTEAPTPAARRIYLRHDVDYSLKLALRLAQINAQLGVRGTFFVLLRSQVYNLLSSWSCEIVGRIHELGQHIALHAVVRGSAPEQVGANLLADFEFARSNLPMLSPVFSWHNPTAELIEGGLGSEQLAGLTNAYSARFIKEIAYFSDSNMRHAADDFLEFVSSGKYPTLQLLLHPLNWVVGGGSMRDVFAGTWPYVIREREYEMRLNSFYRERLPDGMPAALLREFSAQWHRVAGVGDDEV